MILNFDDRSFVGTWGKGGRLTIPLIEEDDKVFFKVWLDMTTSSKKSEYAIQMEYEDFLEQGALLGCFPISMEVQYPLTKNEDDHVVVSYDLKKRLDV